MHHQQGRLAPAGDHLQLALPLYRETGDRIGEARALNNLGLVHLRQGHYERAADHHQRALVRYRETGDRVGQGHALTNLGIVDRRQGRYPQAARHLRQARAHAGLGHAHHTTGEQDQARHHWSQALTLYSDLGVPDADDIRDRLTAADQTVTAEAAEHTPTDRSHRAPAGG